MIKACCRDEANLVHVPIDAERSCDVCRACGCRHFKVKAAAGQLGLKGSPVGPAEAPEEPPQIVITMREDGQLHVVGPIDNKILCYGMLRAAEDVIREHHERALLAATVDMTGATVQ